MKLYGGIYYNEQGISTSIRGMHMQTELLSSINNNVNGFNKVGYQRVEPVISSFSEFVGVHGLSKVKDEGVGRLAKSSNPLDFALGKSGYFQYQTPDGVKLTRDGRFKLDKNGYMLNLEGYKVLSNNGMPVKFSKMPDKLSDVVVGVDGDIKVLNRDTDKLEHVGTFSVVSSDGDIAEKVDVRQGYVENSNVALHQEFFNIVPVKRNFEANRQLYLIQNDALSKVISELGKA